MNENEERKSDAHKYGNYNNYDYTLSYKLREFSEIRLYIYIYKSYYITSSRADYFLRSVILIRKCKVCRRCGILKNY